MNLRKNRSNIQPLLSNEQSFSVLDCWHPEQIHSHDRHENWSETEHTLLSHRHSEHIFWSGIDTRNQSAYKLMFSSLNPHIYFFPSVILIFSQNEHRDRVVNTSASSSGSSWVQISALRSAILIWDTSRFSSVPLGKCRNNALKLGHGRFLRHPFQFIDHLSPHYPALYRL
jgi:hypothetical protein